MSRADLLAVFVLIEVLTSPVWTSAADPYTGNQILPKHEHLDVKVGNSVVATEMDFVWPVTVDRVNGQWLWVIDEGPGSPNGSRVEGWVSKNDVVLLQNDPLINKKSAQDYYSECLAHDPYSGWAHWFRGLTLIENRDWRAAKADLKKAVDYGPWLDGAWDALGTCAYQLMRLEQGGIFDTLHDHGKGKKSHLQEPPAGLIEAMYDFKMALSYRWKPKTLFDWGEALAVPDWNGFQRRIWIFYMDDPEQFAHDFLVNPTDYVTQRRRIDPMTDAGGGRSALCLYEHALELYPQYADALYSRGALFEFVADYRIYQMIQTDNWITLTHARQIRNLKSSIHQSEDETQRQSDALQPLTEEQDRVAALRHAFRNEEVSKKRKKLQAQLDALNGQLEDLNEKLKTQIVAVDRNQKRIDTLQVATLTEIRRIIEEARSDFARANALSSPYISACRDRAAMSLMLINPTGLQPIKYLGNMGLNKAAMAEEANTWAAMAAKAADYEDNGDVRTMPTYAASLNATGDYDGAIRRELSDWDLMNEEERSVTREFVDFFRAQKKAALVRPR
jgi:tetratricopeptide (TPR) repeat protein